MKWAGRVGYKQVFIGGMEVLLESNMRVGDFG